jgi:hypothetical protein
MAENEGKNASVVARLREGYQPANNENRGHQPSKAFDKGYQASGQVKQPTTTPNVGTTAVVPAASATNSSNKK